ncbi:MAG: radical SAM protein, partial [Clostridia bacterium]|nr:radical SAM protein [Clostridia bacterium]
MNIYDFTEEKLRQYFISKGENPAKAKIMINNLYKKRITDFNDISEFGNKIKMMLKSDFSIEPLNLVSKTSCPDTHKFLFELCDGHTIESVLMKHDYGNGICISSQVGCNMNCAFCESGKLKKVRNLTPGEMIQQILEVEKITNESISNIAIMGIGEPFDNYENIIGFTEIAANQSGLG